MHEYSARTRPQVVYPSGSTGAYLLHWLNGRRSLRPSTLLSYRTHLDRHLLPGLGTIPLEQLTLRDIDAHYDQLLGRELSTATVRRVHATLTSALNHAVRRGVLEANPAALVDLPVPQRPELTTWDGEALAAFLAVASHHRLGPLFALVAYTGMRRGEATGLRWRDVDLDGGVLRVEQQIVAVAGRPVVGPPKTTTGRRQIALATPLIALLTAHHEAQRTLRAAAGSAWAETGLVFTDPRGAGLNPTLVSREFDRIVASSGLPRIRFHDLRHTSASVGLASGESLLEVSRRLGHSSITITADVYSHIAPSTARSAAERLAKQLCGGKQLEPIKGDHA